MELPTPSGLETKEPLINSGVTSPGNNTNDSKDGFNQSQIDNFTIKIPFNRDTDCMLFICGFMGFIFFIISLSLHILVAISSIFYTIIFALICLPLFHINWK